ncbi:MAG: UTRA domain-containing protein [Nocardioides sp.]
MARRDPEYLAISRVLRAELIAGNYDEDGSLPGNATIAERFDVNLKTAGRAIQQLIAEKLLIARPGMRPLVVPPERRAAAWPMTGRYARARNSDGLLFATDVTGAVEKATVLTRWETVPIALADLLQVDVATTVFRRDSRTTINGVLSEQTSMFFPRSVIERAPGLEADPKIKVVALLEAAGYQIDRTINEVRARHASPDEQISFGIDAGAVMFEQIHGTYDTTGEPLEAVINLRPASGNVLTFETYEGPDEE